MIDLLGVSKYTNGGGGSNTTPPKNINTVPTLSSTTSNVQTRQTQPTQPVQTPKQTQMVDLLGVTKKASSKASTPTTFTDKWDRYSDPSYKLSSDEKKEVKAEYKRLKKLGIEKNTYHQRDMWEQAIKSGEVDPEYAEKVMKAYDKNSAEGVAYSALTGLGSALAKPVTGTMALGETIGNKISGNDKNNWNEANKAREEAFNESNAINPLATGVGNFAGNMLMYQAANGLLGDGTNALANIAKGQAVDTVLDTIPTIGNDYLMGKYKKEDGSTDVGRMAWDTAMNQATNLGFNGASEFAPQIFKTLKGEYEADALKNALGNNSVADNTVKNITNNVVDAVKDEIPDITKNAEVTDNTLTLNRKQIEKILTDSNERRAFEEQTGLTLEGTKAEQRKQIKDFINGNDNSPIETLEEAIPKQTVEQKIPTVDAEAKPIKEDNGPDVGISKMVEDGTLNRNALTSLDEETGRTIAQYEKHSNEKTVAEAKSRIDTKEGYEYWDKGFTDGKLTISNDTDVDTAMLLALDQKQKIADLNEAAKNGVEGALEESNKMQTKLNLLLLRIRQAGTATAQKLQAFAKYNSTAEGAITNSNRLLDERARKWASKNGKKSQLIDAETAKMIDEISAKAAPPKLPTSSKLRKALDALVDKSVFKTTDGVANKTHADFLDEVKGTFAKEMSSFDNNFTDTDYEVLASFLENKVPTEDIADELAHRLKNGVWYTLDESIDDVAKTNNRVNNAMRAMLGDEVAKSATEMSSEELRKSIKASFDSELGSVFKDITDTDIDYVKNLIESGATKEELASMLKTRASTGKWGIDNEVVQQVTDIFKRAEKLDFNSRTRVELENEAFALLADNIYGRGGTGWEKFDQWRYLAMLGNTKTHIRNIVSNAIFGAVNDVSNTMAATIESLVDKVNKASGGNGIERTKSVINPTSKTDRALLSGAWKDVDEASYRELVGSKYSNSLENKIGSQKRIFKSNSLDWLTNKNTSALEVEDYAFNKKKYATSLSGYLKANGLDDSVFEAERNLERLKLEPLKNADEIAELEKKINTLNKGREYAIKQAQYATFHEDNVIAKGISSLQRNARQSDNALIRAGGKITEGIMPFAKTPMNILRSGIEYSPLGIVRDIGDIASLAKGNINASQFVENLSKTLTGSSLFLLGYWMYDNDMLSASQDDTTGYFDSNQGKQAYSLNIGGKTMTIDFAVPSAMPLLVGAEVAKALGDDGFEITDVNALVNALSAIAEPINETSMLSGLNDTIDAVKNKDNVFGAIAFNALTGYFTQAMPTALGQVARTVDNTRRSTYTENTESVGSVEKQLRKLQNKIPGLSSTNEAYVDLWGREQKNGPDNVAGNLAYQMLSPSYVADVKTTPVDSMIQSLYNATKDESVLPKKYSSTISYKVKSKKSNPYAKDEDATYETVSKKLSSKEFHDYSKATGQVRYKLLNDLSKTSFYRNATTADKKKMVSAVYSLSTTIGKHAVFKEDGYETSKIYKAYKESGSNGVMSYLEDHYIDEDGIPTLK